jgi:hypothetical protein
MWRLESLALEQDGERACSRLQQRDPKLNNQKLALLHFFPASYYCNEELHHSTWVVKRYLYKCLRGNDSKRAINASQFLGENISSWVFSVHAACCNQSLHMVLYCYCQIAPAAAAILSAIQVSLLSCRYSSSP